MHVCTCVLVRVRVRALCKHVVGRWGVARDSHSTPVWKLRRVNVGAALAHKSTPMPGSDPEPEENRYRSEIDI